MALMFSTEFISLILDQNKTIIDGKRVGMNWGTILGQKACQYSAVSLAPGRYDLHILAEDPAKNSRAETEAELRIKLR
jgi:hypothetical protein